MTTSDQYREVLEATLQHALKYFSKLDESPVAAASDLAELRQSLDQALPVEGREATQVLNELVLKASDGLNDCAGGRFFAWVIGGALPVALAADWMTSVWDQNAGMYAVAPSAAVIEEVVGRWLLELLELPKEASFALVTGCQMAHVTCLAAARNGVLHRQGWDVETDGLVGAPPIRVLSGDQHHGTIERSLRLLGLGRRSLIELPVELDGKLGVETLRDALQREPGAPTIVLLQAGDINTGSFDSFEALIPLAHEFGAWVHVDGAFGLWAKASPGLRYLLTGVEKADSWATDGHKWLNVPYDCGYAIVSDREAHYRSFAHQASYLDHSQVARDQVDWNPEYSRRARGIASYAALLSLGQEGVADLVDRCCRFARRIVEESARFDGVEALCLPVINQGLLRFVDENPEATEDDHDRRTDAVVRHIVASGEAFFACTSWKKKRCMRVSVCNWQTNDSDITRTVEAIRKVVLACRV